MSTWPPAPPPDEGPQEGPPSLPPPPPAWGASPGWSGPPGYGQPLGPMPVTSATNQACLVGMILGIFSLVGAGCCAFLGVPLAIGGIITGIVGLNQVRDRPSQGRSMAIAGIACGSVGIVLAVLLVVVRFGFSFSSGF